MRLLNTTTITLSCFDGDDVPHYAILSHTWGDAEISFQDLLAKAPSELGGLAGYAKIRSCCALAAQQGYEYVWIDTCCIDKTSSGELSEAINSMYRYYQEAQVCYAYLADVRITDSWCSDTWRDFRRSRWFTRGWTLQELLAPKQVIFYGSDWQELGSKSSLSSQISLITGIQLGHMNDINSASVAQKMSWASRRETTIVEDIAYSLMGIFDVNMPQIYGEGKKAFMRLQHEIVKSSDDESIFAWMDAGLIESGIFAQSPKAFAQSGDVVQIIDGQKLYLPRPPYSVTNRGLAIEIIAWEDAASNKGISFVPLNCGRLPDSGDASVKRIDIELEKVSRDDFVRSSPWRLEQSLPRIEVSSTRLVYVRPVYTPYDTYEHQRSFFIKALPLTEKGFSILKTYACQSERHLWDLPDKRCWSIRLQKSKSVAALLLQSDRHKSQQRFAVILRANKSIVGIDVIVPSSDQTFQEEINQYEFSYHNISPIETQRFKLLQDGSLLAMILKSEEVVPGTGRKRHLVEFAIEEGYNEEGRGDGDEKLVNRNRGREME